MQIPIHIHIMLEAWGARLVGTHLLKGNKIVRIPYTTVVRYLLKNYGINIEDVLTAIRGKGLLLPTSPSARSLYSDSIEEMKEALAELPRVKTVRKQKATHSKMATLLRRQLNE